MGPRDAEVVVGTSVGSIIGALLRVGVPAHDLAASMVGVALLETPQPLAALPRAWPDRPLWLTGVRQHDLQRVVFGDGTARRPALGEAVAASCAVPGYFRPVEVDGARYLDGGVRSPTNADVLVGAGVDLAIIVSPLSSHGGGTPVAQVPLRRYAARKVRNEQRRLEAAGIPTVVLAPGADVTVPFGSGLLVQDHVRELTRASFLDAGRQLARPDVAAALAELRPTAQAAWTA